MDIALLLIGYLLGMISIINTIRFALSCASSYIVMKMIFPNLHIWKFEDYNDWENYVLFWDFEWKWLCIGLVVLFICLFYWWLPKFFIKIISEKIGNRIQKIYSSLSNRQIFKAKGFARWGLRKFYFYASYIYTPDEKLDIQQAPSYNYMSKVYARMFSMAIHTVIVFIFLFNNFWIYLSSFFVIVLSSILILWIIPVFFVAKNHILNIVAEEHNRFVV